uniref:Uncharacterized protein n=1 Tax=Anguilla anguilla TaxID=7936 RepID=A0A0E9SX60_ANGAN
MMHSFPFINASDVELLLFTTSSSCNVLAYVSENKEHRRLNSASPKTRISRVS